MGKWIWKQVYREVSSTERAAWVFTLFTVLATLLGVVRERLLAVLIGPGPVTDAYIAAFRIPDIITLVVATVLSFTTLMPHIVEAVDVTARKKLISSLATVFGVALVTLCVVVGVLMPHIVRFLVPGFTLEYQSITVSLSRIMLVVPLVLGLSSMLSSITQYYNRFVALSLSPVFYNVGIIIGIAVLYPLWGVNGLAVGVVGAALLHLGVHIPFVRSVGQMPVISSSIDWGLVRRVFMTAVPRAISLSFGQLVVLGITALASLLLVGGISLFNLAIVIQTTPITMIGSSIALASYTTLVKFRAANDTVSFSKQLLRSLESILLLSIPVSVLFFVLSYGLVSGLFSGGGVTVQQITIAGAILGVLSVGIWAQSIFQLGIRALYAQGAVWSPLRYNFIFLLWVCGAGYLVSGPLKDSSVVLFVARLITPDQVWVAHGLILLSLVYCIGAVLQSVLVWVFLFRNMVGITRLEVCSVIRNVSCSICAGVMGSILGWLLYHYLLQVWSVTSSIEYLGVIAIIIVLIVLIWLFIMYIANVSTVRKFVVGIKVL